MAIFLPKAMTSLLSLDFYLLGLLLTNDMMHLFKTKGRKACFPQGLNQ
jgi:hypothetical protein